MNSVLNQPKKHIILKVLYSIPLVIFSIFAFLFILILKAIPPIKYLITKKKDDEIPLLATKMCQIRTLLYQLNLGAERNYEAAFLNLADRTCALILGLVFKIFSCKPSDKLGLIPFTLARRFETEKLLRKLAADYEADENDLNNFKNVVLFGAQFETIFHQFQEILPKHCGLKLFEVDTTVKQKFKLKKILATTTLPWCNKIRYCSVDFEDDVDFIEKMKTATQFDPSLKTLYIWTGSAPYLEKETVRKCLFKIRAASKAVKSQILIDCVKDFKSCQISEDVAPRLKQMLEQMEKYGVAWKWGVNCLDDFVKGENYRLVEYMSPDKMTDDYFTTEKGDVNMKVFEFGHLGLIEVA